MRVFTVTRKSTLAPLRITVSSGSLNGVADFSQVNFEMDLNKNRDTFLCLKGP